MTMDDARERAEDSTMTEQRVPHGKLMTLAAEAEIEAWPKTSAWYWPRMAYLDLRDTRAALKTALDREAAMKAACVKINEAVCQTLGKVLGYPWFKDDPVNFPGSTEEHGVCVGEHVAESIAAEAAKHITATEASNRALVEALQDAGKVFRDYERMHLAKSPPDYQKAERNSVMAAKCETYSRATLTALQADEEAK